MANIWSIFQLYGIFISVKHLSRPDKVELGEVDFEYWLGLDQISQMTNPFGSKLRIFLGIKYSL